MAIVLYNVYIVLTKEKPMKKAVAIILAITLAFSNSAFATSVIFSISHKISHGLTYEESTCTTDDGKDNHTYAFKYVPGQSTFPVVAWGDSQKSRKVLTKIATLYGENAVAGVNADFFSFQTGIPLGCVVSEGRFLSSAVNNNALAVLEDGSLYIGTPDIKTTLAVGGEEFSFYYNKYPTVYSLYIMDSTYFSATASEFSCLEIVLKPTDTSLKVNTSVKCTVMSVNDSTSNTQIEEDRFVLSVPESHPSYPLLSALHVGETLELNVTGSEIWESAEYVVGGGDIIVRDGAFVPETADEYSDKVRYARTAVGICPDGSGIFFAVNGKKENFSAGMSYEELANAMIDMGCETVLNLDGGGSTTVGVKYSHDGKLEVVNYPTDGYPRGISNAILFLNTGISDGIAVNAELFPNLHFVLPNSAAEIEETFFDSSMTPIHEIALVNTEYFSESDEVSFDSGKLFIGDTEESEIKISAQYTVDEEKVLTVEKSFFVPSTLDNLSLRVENPVLDAFGKSTVSTFAEYYGFEVASAIGAFKWSFDENNAEELLEGELARCDMARLLEDGTVEILTDEIFTSTALIAEYQGVTASAEIYVGYRDFVLEDFEGIEREDEAVPQNDVAFPVEGGYKSNTAAYLRNGTAMYETPLKLDLYPKKVTLMYKGKYTSPAALLVIGPDGEKIAVPYTVKNDYSEVTGWSELEAVLPENLNGTVYIASPFASPFDNEAVIDTLTVSYGFTEPVFDDTENSWAKDYIENIYDMGLISGYEDNGKTLFDPNRDITRAEFAKLVALFNKYNLSEGEVGYFNDAEEIPLWAAPYITAVAENSVMNGRAEGDGTLTFAPTAPITRTETMLVVSRLIESSVYDTLSFDDASLVPIWAEEGVKKVVSSGIITGYDDNTLRPDNNITRAEVAVVFSRLFNYIHRSKH